MSITNTFNVNIARIKDISVKEHKKQQINESFLYSLILFTILQLFLTALILSSYVESIIISWNCSITLWSGMLYSIGGCGGKHASVYVMEGIINNKMYVETLENS